MQRYLDIDERNMQLWITYHYVITNSFSCDS
jgi:hypothetical protein